jgi:hypothetical protein
MGKKLIKKTNRQSKLDKLTHLEISDVRWLASKGWTHNEIAKHLGVSDRTLNRWRSKPKGNFLNRAIEQGQSVYNLPSSELGCCLMAESDRLDIEWLSFSFVRRSNEKGLFINPHSVTSSNLLSITGVHPESAEGEQVLQLVKQMKSVQSGLGLMDLLDTYISTTEAYERYCEREPLRWSLINKDKAKYEKTYSEGGSDMNSKSNAIDETNS